MLKDYMVKNPALNKTLFDKWTIRKESDGTIPVNRFVEIDGSTEKVEVAGASSVRVIGANQDKARADGDFFDVENGAVEVVTGGPVVAGQRVKAGASGKAVAFIDSVLADTEIVAVDGADFTNQPDDDTITVVSSSADDDTQTLTVYGIDDSGAFISQEFELDGTTDVDSTDADWSVVCGAILDSACAGDVEISEKSGGLEIVTISAGDLSAGIETITDGFAYSSKVNVVADGASTKKLIVVHQATEGASETNLLATLNGTTDVALGTASYKITKMMIGDVEDTVEVSAKVNSTEDDLKLSVGRALTDGDDGDTITVLMG